MFRKIKAFLLKNTNYGKSRYLNFLYKYDMKQFFEYSCMHTNDDECIATEIRLISHSIEKAMTLPESKMDFGKEKILHLISLYDSYSKLNKRKDEQVLILAKATVNSYAEYQKNRGADVDFIPKEFLVNSVIDDAKVGVAILKASEKTNFKEIALHRHSSRNFSEKSVPDETIKEVVRIAQTAPSACNRQSIRVFACKNPDSISEIVKIHGGLRGFGKPAIIFAITGDLRLYTSEYERNTVFVDGGIFLMNLLYSLDSFGLASCPIIWGSEPDNDSFIKNILNIPQNHRIISLVVAGYYPDKTYKAAVSCKRPLKDILFIKK